MSKIFVGSDHRGFELKNGIRTWLHEQGYDVVDCGNTILDPLDDDVDFAQAVVSKVLEDPINSLGLVFCGTGVAVAIAANRHKGIYCGLGFDPQQAVQARSHDHINMLSLPAQFISEEVAKEVISSFLTTPLSGEDKYLRRLRKIDAI